MFHGILGWMVALKRICLLPHPWNLWILPYKVKKKKKRILTYITKDVTKLRIGEGGACPGLSWWALNPVTNIRASQRDIQQTHRQEVAMGPGQAGLERCSHTPRNTNSDQKLEEVKNRFSPTGSIGKLALPIHWFWAFRYQNCVRIIF